jgi:hypothetical protein
VEKTKIVTKEKNIEKQKEEQKPEGNQGQRKNEEESCKGKIIKENRKEHQRDKRRHSIVKISIRTSSETTTYNV